jgi:hypothetical protein
MILWEKISHSGGKRWEIQESVDGRTRTIAIVRFEEHADQIVALPGLVNAAREAIKAVDNNNRGFVGQMQDLKKALEAYQ